MSWVLVPWVFVNIVLFGVLLGYALRLQRRWRSTSIRFIATALVLVSGTFLVASVQRLGIQASRAGIVAEEWEDFFLTDYQVLLSLIGTVAGVYAITRLRTGIRHLERSERMLGVLTDKVPLDLNTEDWKLTARETEVLDAIVAGQTSDQEIADALYISTATAATHVRNILRKTGLSNRLDLMLVGGRGVDDPRQGKEPGSN